MVDKKEVQNLVVVSLNDSFTKRTASLLSEKLDMLCVNCHEMIVYDLINPKEVLVKCGLEYFKKREKGVIKNCSTFLNTCISINFDLLNQYAEFFEKSLVFFLKLPYEKITNVPDRLDFINRNGILENLTDHTINLDKKSITTAVDKILEKMGVIYENS